MSKPVTTQDMFDLWQKMVNPSAYPLQSLMFPMMDPEELQKKLHELEVVEHWLKANVNMVQLTQKSLQYQLAILKGAEKAQDVLAGHDAPEQPAAPGGDIPNPALWAWNMMAEAAKSAGSAYTGEHASAPEAPKKKRRRKS
jgi:hypothetical protein